MSAQRPGLCLSIEQRLEALMARFDRIEKLLATMSGRSPARQWLTTEEFAEAVGKAPYTVREWARKKRVHAEKRMSGRGKFQDWCISAAELRRYEREGLLPRRLGGERDHAEGP